MVQVSRRTLLLGSTTTAFATSLGACVPQQRSAQASVRRPSWPTLRRLKPRWGSKPLWLAMSPR